MVTDRTTAESLSSLLARLGVSDEVAKVPEVSLSTLLSDTADPGSLLSYLTRLGVIVRRLDDLMLINAMEDEEELSAHRVAEGIAISVASQGDWLLFRP